MPTISVATGSSELVADEDIPTPFDDLVVLATLGNLSLPKEIVRVNLQNVYRSSKKYLKYGSDTYMHGLPSESFSVTEAFGYNQDVVDIVTINEAPEVVIHESLSVGVRDDEVYIMEYLQDHKGWNPVDNLVTHNGNTGTYQGYTEDTLNGIYEIMYTYGTFDYINTDFGGTNYNFTYHYESTPTITRYWNYQSGLSTYPQLGVPPINTGTYTSAFYPIVAIRTAGINRQDVAGLEKDQVTSMLDTLDVSLEALTDGIEDSDDINEISDVFVEFSADVYSTSDAEVMYNYMFFKFLQANASQDRTDFDATRNLLTPNPITPALGVNGTFDPQNNIPVNFNTFTIVEGAYKKTYKFYYIESRTLTGTVGGNDYSTSIVTRPDITAVEYVSAGWSTLVSYNRNSVIFRKQLTSTTYERLEVFGLTVDTELTYYKHGTGTGSQYHNVSSEVLDADGTSNIRIPISHILITDLKLKERVDLLYRSMSMAINVVQRTYTAGWKTFIAAVFPPIMAAFQIISLVMPMLAAVAQGLTAAAIAIVDFILTSYVFDSVFTFLVTKLDGVLGDILAVALFIYKGIDGKSSFESLHNMLTADVLVDAVTAITKIKQIELVEDFETLQEEYDEFNTELKDRQEEQDILTDGLVDNSDLLAGLIERTPQFFAYEDANSYYERAVHDKNAGVATKQFASTYVARMLTLPTADY